jgi:hypothetical protein
MSTQDKTWKSIQLENEIATRLDKYQFDTGQYVVDSTSDGFTVRDTRNPEESQETVHFEVTKILLNTCQLRITTRDAPIDVKYEVDTDTVAPAVDRIRGILDGLFLQQQANR